MENSPFAPYMEARKKQIAGIQRFEASMMSAQQKPSKASTPTPAPERPALQSLTGNQANIVRSSSEALLEDLLKKFTAPPKSMSKPNEHDAQKRKRDEASEDGAGDGGRPQKARPTADTQKLTQNIFNDWEAGDLMVINGVNVYVAHDVPSRPPAPDGYEVKELVPTEPNPKLRDVREVKRLFYIDRNAHGLKEFPDMPLKNVVEWRAQNGVVIVKIINTACQFQGILVQSRGTMVLPCTACKHSKGPFANCVVLIGYKLNACGCCIWSGKGSECSHRLGGVKLRDSLIEGPIIDEKEKVQPHMEKVSANATLPSVVNSMEEAAKEKTTIRASSTPNISTSTPAADIDTKPEKAGQKTSKVMVNRPSCPQGGIRHFDRFRSHRHFWVPFNLEMSDRQELLCVISETQALADFFQEVADKTETKNQDVADDEYIFIDE